jgi:hypothetical protein
MQHTLQSLQNEFDETRQTSKGSIHKDQLFRNKIQRRFSDKEKASVPTSFQRSPTPSTSIMIKHHTVHTSSQSPKQGFY